MYQYYSKDELYNLATILKPPPIITGSEWANEKRILSKEDSAEPGKYSTLRAPFQKEPLDEITNPYNEEIVLEWSSQIGKTLIATNILGYYIEQDPSSIMYVIETLAKAENFSKARLDPMIRDNPWLPIERKVKTSGNTILEKMFPGGYLSIVGANSPAGFTSKPIRILILDEVDNYPQSAGAMGSPVDLAIQRTETYDNRKIIKISSPGIEGISNIHPAYLATDMRKYKVPCPRCGFPQELIFEQIKFPDKIADNCYYECENCKAKLEEKDKFEMIKAGEWVKTYPERIHKPGFHLSRLYSVFSPWSKVVDDFLKAQKAFEQGDPTKKQVFWNSSLARVWNPYISPSNKTELLKRVPSTATPTTTLLPSKVLLLTCGIDVQDDRLELEIFGWCLDEEVFTIEEKILTGEPALPGIWNELDEYLKVRFKHPLGLSLGITATCIDTGGHFASKVYDFVRYKQARRIFAIRGSSTSGKSIAPNKPTYNNKGKIPLYIIGTETAKDHIYSKLRIAEGGPGYMHFERTYCDDNYFDQLTSNIRVNRKNGYGYDKLPGRRDEVLDRWVYGYAALKIYNRDLRLIKKVLEQTAINVTNKKDVPTPQIKRKSFATR